MSGGKQAAAPKVEQAAPTPQQQFNAVILAQLMRYLGKDHEGAALLLESVGMLKVLDNSPDDRDLLVFVHYLRDQGALPAQAALPELVVGSSPDGYDDDVAP